jgi:hypothetical protein
MQVDLLRHNVSRYWEDVAEMHASLPPGNQFDEKTPEPIDNHRVRSTGDMYGIVGR